MKFLPMSIIIESIGCVVPADEKTPFPPMLDCLLRIKDPAISSFVLLVVGGATSALAMVPPLASGPVIEIFTPFEALAPIVLSETTSPATLTVVIVRTPLLRNRTVFAVRVTLKQKKSEATRLDAEEPTLT